MGAKPLFIGMPNLTNLEDILQAPPLSIIEVSLVFSADDYPKVVSTVLLEEGSGTVTNYPTKKQMNYLLEMFESK